jgi:GNAT superfamily N-acetyltransferase
MDETTGPALELTGYDPRARALVWYLDHFRRRWHDASEDDVRRAYRSDDPVPPARRLRIDRGLAEKMPPLDLDQVRAVSDHEAIARLRDAQGRGWRVRAIMHPPEPDRLRWAFLTREPPPGVVIRPCTPSEGPALAALERRVPIVDGEVRRVYDRGEDYFAATAVPDEHLVLGAEMEGALVGMYGQVRHPARAAGRLLRVGYLRHLRVDPRARGRGILSALVGASGESAVPHCDAPWSLTGASNDTVDRRGMQDTGRSPAVQLRVDARAAATRIGLPSPPGPADAEAIAAFLDRSIGALELTRPWTPEDVSARVETVGLRYGWDRLAFTGEALLGVERTPVAVETQSPAGTSIRRRVLAFDVAALPGCESQLEGLVRAWCSRLAEEGIDDLLIMVSSPTLRRVLEPIASQVTPFNLNHDFAVAIDAAARGYSIDGMLF